MTTTASPAAPNMAPRRAPARPGFSGRLEPLALWAGRLALAAVWVYNGLLSKLLDRSGRHTEIVATALDVALPAGRLLAGILGILECGLAIAVVTGRRPWLVCGLQLGLLVGMNAGGLLGSPELIPNAPEMILHNMTFAALCCCVAAIQEGRHAVIGGVG